MDIPTSSVRDNIADTANKICALCTKNKSIYVCPQCSINYCSVQCYKSVMHLDCSESFYKQCVEEELKSQERDPKDQRKMIDILKRLHDDDMDNFLYSDTDDENNVSPVDSDDDNDVLDLEDRLKNVNLDNADEVWSVLTSSERQEFEALIKNGEVEKLVPKWIPWWTYNIEKKLIQDLEMDKANIDATTLNFPPLVDVPIFNELSKASPNVQFNLLNVIYAYAYLAIYYNGDYLSSAVEAGNIFFAICDNLKKNTIFNNKDAAIQSLFQNITDCESLPKNDEIILAMKEAANSILKGPEGQNKSFYISIALSELHRLLVATQEVGANTKNEPHNQEFSKKFQKTFETDKALSKKTVLLGIKKIEYYLSWVKSRA